MTALDPKSVQMMFGYVLPHQCVLEADKIPGQSRKVSAHVFLTGVTLILKDPVTHESNCAAQIKSGWSDT